MVAGGSGHSGPPATQYKTGQEWISACRLYARRNAPCLTSGFLSLVVREAPGLGTMGVTKDWKMLYDPELRKVWTVKQGATVFFHELWHRLRRHAERCEACGADHGLFNIAGDAEINDDINTSSKVWEFPAVTVDGEPTKHVMPAWLLEFVGGHGGMPDGQMAEAYWEALRDAQKKRPRGRGGKGGEPGNEPGEGGAKGSSKPGPGWCGSGAGQKLPDEPEPDGKGRTSAEQARIIRDVAEAIKADAAKGRGSVPGGWVVWADTQLAPPKIPWQTKLAKIARGHVEWAAGAVDYRYDRPSRRQGGIGYGPGRPVLPALRAPKPVVLAVADTSGSMGKDELSLALGEIKGVLTKTNADVTFCAADAAVHGLKKVRNWREILPLLKGGGGTDFRPAFEAASKMKPRPNVVIFATDGDGTCPDAPPAGMRVIWVLTGKHANSPCAWGEQIRVE
jgi:predicted metal-dependent peptidase